MTTDAFPERLSNVACVQNRQRAGRKARIHNGVVAGKQPGSSTPPECPGIEAVEADSMGRYIDDILQPGEKVLYSTNAHWIFFLPAITGWVVAVVFLVLSRMVANDTPMLLCWSMAAIAAVFALYKTATAWFHRWTTETDVTNLRVVHKTGFIKRQTFEMSLDKVESVDVNQSILGRILNYGDVSIFGVGEGNKTISTIASPLEFRNYITAR
jgi:membrane protein YdbS with pleckstrin-like domain